MVNQIFKIGDKVSCKEDIYGGMNRYKSDILFLKNKKYVIEKIIGKDKERTLLIKSEHGTRIQIGESYFEEGFFTLADERKIKLEKLDKL